MCLMLSGSELDEGMDTTSHICQQLITLDKHKAQEREITANMCKTHQ